MLSGSPGAEMPPIGPRLPRPNGAQSGEPFTIARYATPKAYPAANQWRVPMRRALLFTGLVLLGCGPTQGSYDGNCQSNELNAYRCKQNMVEVCTSTGNGTGKWYVVNDCSVPQDGVPGAYAACALDSSGVASCAR